MIDRTGMRRRRASADARIALLALVALAQPWSVAAGPAPPSAEHLAAARDYVVSARFVEMLDGLVNRFAADAQVASDPDDLAMKRRVVRDISREVMADSLVRSLATDAPIDVLRAGAAYAKSDVGRIESSCLSNVAQGPESYPACIKAGASAEQLAQIEKHGASESGLALMSKVLKGDALVAALNAATRDLVERDPELAAQLADYCKRKPDEGMCGYRTEADKAGEHDERR